VSEAEDALAWQLKFSGFPEPEREFRFCARRWRFDFAWPTLKLAVEVEGGTWAGGRHTTGAGFEKDAEKYNEAVVLGWRVLRVTPNMIEDGRALALLERVRTR
jgi:very-short-patch-repair endonuclease